MPVTARLSKQFYDRFGEQVTNELVDWFNQVDAAYKSDLRELADLYFSRFEAKLEQFKAEVNSRIADARADLARWLFLAWATLLVPIVGLWMR